MLSNGPYDYYVATAAGIGYSIRIEECHFRFLNITENSFYIFNIDTSSDEYNKLKELLERYRK